MNIYIKLEILSRELKAKLLLGMYAASKGHQVLIGDDEILKMVEKKELNPGIILEKSITPAESRLNQLKNYNKNKSVVTSLDEETPLSTNDLDLFCEVRFSEKSINLSNKVFCWSSFDFQILSKLFSKLSEKFVITGNPRMELWKEKYNDLYKSAQTRGKKFIMISSNIGIGLWSTKYSSVVKLLKNNGYFSNKKYEKFFYDWMSYNFRLLHKFTSAINYLTERFPNYNFLVRPHPSENVENWKNILIERENLTITKDFDHSYWIQNSEIIIHNGCTGGLEGFIRKKKVIVYKPLEQNGVLEFANQFGEITKNQTELGDIVQKLYNEKEPSSLNTQLYDKFVSRYGDIINSNSNQNIIKEWEKYKSFDLSKKNNLFFTKIKNKLRFLKNIFVKPRHNEKFPNFEKENINNLFNSMKKTDHNLKNVKINLIGPKLFQLKLQK